MVVLKYSNVCFFYLISFLSRTCSAFGRFSSLSPSLCLIKLLINVKYNSSINSSLSNYIFKLYNKHDTINTF